MNILFAPEIKKTISENFLPPMNQIKSYTSTQSKKLLCDLTDEKK